MRFLHVTIFFFCIATCSFAQHNFNGYVDTERWKSDVYLSIIEDYRTLENIDNEQIISKVSTDADGYFQFLGNQLDDEQRIYKLHVDNCESFNQDSNHFDGHCTDSKDILFIAKSTDTISFPLSFDAEMFCDIDATNPKTAAFIKIDSLKEEMKFAYSEFRSKANRDLNNKKWFKTLQDFGINLNEPLAELYIYAFLSERGSPFHNYYLEDLKANTYYDNLLERLKTTYPNTSYTKQYEAEIASDKFIATPPNKETSGFNWIYVLVPLLVLSLILNFWFISKYKINKKKKQNSIKEQLTKQEQNVLDLILKEHTNKEIADALFVSVSTVKTHVNNIYKKLNTNSRDEIKSLFNN
ncbi:LuxR family transcriptional regulator [Hyunsoonleella flava]|uniref:LuxR family transcriptional regulator n=1 Tax=Hyunsoonleella flava TaxID=2527939 RepID=A0A4Q9FGB8_9FLAO|nr:helix-turn-helix transcriptional regulator [Hyunsoonleella flava]TBN00847.1 LuxR family transcriptional regulator [Hyunsoonleella flava]